MTTSLVVTGRVFVGNGIRAFEPLLHELLVNCKSEVHVMAYVITASALPFLEQLRMLLQKGINVTLIMNAIADHDSAVQLKLSELGSFSHCRIVDFSSMNAGILHAKTLVVDRSCALIGSANFTWGGFVGNHEVGVMVTGEQAWQLATLIDRTATNHAPPN